MKNKTLLWLTAAALLSFPGKQAAAAIINDFDSNFDGNSTTANWNTASNWTLGNGTGTIPLTDEDKATVTARTGGAQNLNVNVDGIHVGELEYKGTSSGAQRLTMANSLTVSYTFQADTLVKNGGFTLAIQNGDQTGSPPSSLTVEVGNLYLNEGHMELGTTYSLGGFSVTDSSFIASGRKLFLAGVQGNRIELGHVTMSGGYLVLGGRGYSSGIMAVSSLTGSGYVEVSDSATHNGTAGTLEINSSNATPATFSGILRNQSRPEDPAVLTVVKKGAGTQILSRAAGNTYTGNTTIEGGVLAVTNTSGSGLGAGTVEVKASGVLAGSGFIAPGAGQGLVVQTGGAVAPSAHLSSGLATLTLNGVNNSGGTPPLLDMKEGSFFTIRFGTGNQSDSIAFQNYFEGGWEMFSGGIALNGLNVQEGSFTLFTFNSIADSEIDSLTSLLRVGSGFSGYDADFSWSGDSILLGVSIVPEPGILGLLAAGVLLSCLRRRR